MGNKKVIIDGSGGVFAVNSEGINVVFVASFDNGSVVNETIWDITEGEIPKYILEIDNTSQSIDVVWVPVTVFGSRT